MTNTDEPGELRDLKRQIARVDRLRYRLDEAYRERRKRNSNASYKRRKNLAEQEQVESQNLPNSVRDTVR